MNTNLSHWERHRLIGDLIAEFQRRLLELDVLGEYHALADKLGQQARLAFETARRGADEAGR